MDNAEFNRIVERRMVLIKQILTSKAKEYARGERLHNFKRAAALAAITPEMALRGMLAKHIVSIWDLVDDIENDFEPAHLLAFSKEKIGDAINYLILLEAIIEERTQPNVVFVPAHKAIDEIRKKLR